MKLILKYILYTRSFFRLQVVEVRELLSKGIGVHHGGILPLLKGERVTTMAPNGIFHMSNVHAPVA